MTFNSSLIQCTLLTIVCNRGISATSPDFTYSLTPTYSPLIRYLKNGSVRQGNPHPPCKMDITVYIPSL